MYSPYFPWIEEPLSCCEIVQMPTIMIRNNKRDNSAYPWDICDVLTHFRDGATTITSFANCGCCNVHTLLRTDDSDERTKRTFPREREGMWRNWTMPVLAWQCYVGQYWPWAHRHSKNSDGNNIYTRYSKKLQLRMKYLCHAMTYIYIYIRRTYFLFNRNAFVVDFEKYEIS